MFLSINKLPNNIPQGDEPDSKAAQALQEGLGGHASMTMITIVVIIITPLMTETRR
jgi:hypothetical protein